MDKSIYSSKEDSYLLAEEVGKFLKKEKNKKIKILDMGTGSGFQAENCRRLGFENILCVDINKKAVKFVKKLGFETVYSDLFSKIKRTGKFDLIIFNPPYLPEDKYDKERDTSGGKFGDETVLRFLNQVKSCLSRDGKIFLLLSSLTPKEKIFQEINKQKLVAKKIGDKKIFFEGLGVWVISFA